MHLFCVIIHLMLINPLPTMLIAADTTAVAVRRKKISMAASKCIGLVQNEKAGGVVAIAGLVEGRVQSKAGGATTIVENNMFCGNLFGKR